MGAHPPGLAGAAQRGGEMPLEAGDGLMPGACVKKRFSEKVVELFLKFSLSMITIPTRQLEIRPRLYRT